MEHRQDCGNVPEAVAGVEEVEAVARGKQEGHHCSGSDRQLNGLVNKTERDEILSCVVDHEEWARVDVKRRADGRTQHVNVKEVLLEIDNRDLLLRVDESSANASSADGEALSIGWHSALPAHWTVDA